MTQLPGPASRDFPSPSPDRRPLSYGEIRRGSATHGRDLRIRRRLGRGRLTQPAVKVPAPTPRTGDPCDAAVIEPARVIPPGRDRPLSVRPVRVLAGDCPAVARPTEPLCAVL